MNLQFDMCCSCFWNVSNDYNCCIYIYIYLCCMLFVIFDLFIFWSHLFTLVIVLYFDVYPLVRLFFHDGHVPLFCPDVNPWSMTWKCDWKTNYILNIYKQIKRIYKMKKKNFNNAKSTTAVWNSESHYANVQRKDI
jgi:hypothetical protein